MHQSDVRLSPQRKTLSFFISRLSVNVNKNDVYSNGSSFSSEVSQFLSFNINTFEFKPGIAIVGKGCNCSVFF